MGQQNEVLAAKGASQNQALVAKAKTSTKDAGAMTTKIGKKQFGKQ